MMTLLVYQADDGESGLVGVEAGGTAAYIRTGKCGWAGPRKEEDGGQQRSGPGQSFGVAGYPAASSAASNDLSLVGASGLAVGLTRKRVALCRKPAIRPRDWVPGRRLP